MSLSRVLLLAALVDAAIGITAVAATALVLHHRLRITAMAVVLGVGAALAAGAAQAVLFLDDGYSALHLAYLVIVVGLPVIGAVVAALWLGSATARRLDVTATAGVCAVVLLGLAGAGWWGTHVEPFRLRVDRAELDVAQIDGGAEPVRIGVLADLQTADVGDHEWDAVRRLNEADVDVVVLPGDFVEGPETRFLAQLPELQRLLGALEAPGGVFLVAGDSDSPQRLQQIVEGTDLTALDNDLVAVEVGGRRLWLGGIELRYKSGNASAAVDRLAGAGDDEDVRVLVAHRPDAGYFVGDSGRVDLVVAGHTHGGQIAVPLVGPLVTLSDVPRSIGAGGLHELDGQPIYVGTGVGMVRGTAPQVRFLVPPSVGVVTIG